MKVKDVISKKRLSPAAKKLKNASLSELFLRNAVDQGNLTSGPSPGTRKYNA